ncbi:hypothetical protein V2G26_005083 [Clonostachys chloroleuca]|uniref:Uncharacterized protein n=2 Tax=Clonostachys TaxID=110564 RepID=A0A9N9VQJ4_9HYPO|nr:unnamed protein product [Clonostachys rhizophaga]CAI6095014.1 unnamed protein product [Clonostachys chloroleuca]
MSALVGVAVGGMIIGVLSLIAAIVIIVLSIVILCRCHKQNDRARTGVTYLKVTAGFILLYQVLVIISLVLSVTTASTRYPGRSIRMNFAVAHIEAINTVFSTACMALFIATQFEFARGLKMIAAMSGHGESANTVEVKARKSRFFSVFALALVMIVSIAAFGLYEAYIAGNYNMGEAQSYLVFAVEAILAIAAIVCLVFTARQPRIPPHSSLATHLIVISTLTAIRHITMAVIRGYFTWGFWALVDSDSTGTAAGLTAASALAVIANSWLFCITLGMAYGVCRKEYGGLRANTVYAPVKTGHV